MSAEDAVFRALAASKRRAILDHLLECDGQSLSELRDRVGLTRQAVSAQLGVLERAGLITCRRRSREKLHFLATAKICLAGRWIRKFGGPPRPWR